MFYLLQGLPCHIHEHYVVVGVGAGIGGSERQSPTQHFTRASHYLLLNHLLLLLLLLSRFSHLSIWLNAAVLHCHSLLWASLVAQTVKNLPARPEAWVQSLGLDDTLQK